MGFILRYPYYLQRIDERHNFISTSKPSAPTEGSSSIRGRPAESSETFMQGDLYVNCKEDLMHVSEELLDDVCLSETRVVCRSQR
ncbi:hypothetical protein D9615_010550 [Tricholomella constricta]|uniref:Uncharacterized protein n=1 Tax=Tricholomella constricta TaxID=117010 RepID=A0A8H5H512_9AGAR|nr:hypothetical protein D9615_010550 [Tricholomella constricta]